MKKLLIVTLFFCYFNAFSQSSKKNDSIFYLLDTAKTPTADGMWSVSTDKGSDFKYYAIQCHALSLTGCLLSSIQLVRKERRENLSIKAS